MYKKISGVDSDHCRENMVNSKLQLQDYLSQLSITKAKYQNMQVQFDKERAEIARDLKLAESFKF